MDEDGFFMGELDNVRGLVPSNFLTESPEQYNSQGVNNQRNVHQRGRGQQGQGQGLGARGPPLPPRDNMGQVTGLNQRGQQRKGMIN